MAGRRGIAAYRAQADEEGFRQLKDRHLVPFSPMHHWTEQKIRVHVFYCVSPPPSPISCAGEPTTPDYTCPCANCRADIGCVWKQAPASPPPRHSSGPLVFPQRGEQLVLPGQYLGQDPPGGAHQVRHIPTGQRVHHRAALPGRGHDP